MEHLKPGTYKIKSKLFGNEYKLIIHHGSFKIVDLYDKYLKHITIQNILEYYDILERLPARDKNFNIQYFVNGKLRETITVNASYGIVRKKMNDMKRMSYKTGLLIAVAIK